MFYGFSWGYLGFMLHLKMANKSDFLRISLNFNTLKLLCTFHNNDLISKNLIVSFVCFPPQNKIFKLFGEFEEYTFIRESNDFILVSNTRQISPVRMRKPCN